ncbi:MAG: hypothetical protein F6K11_03325 [Leptolyngbya sp. SIO3F4]|nr:hypothetical protein [Leptolyngbya sp. SIO3F4]
MQFAAPDKGYIRKLIRMALIISPLMGIYSVTPIALFINSLPGGQEKFVEEYMPFRVLSAIGIIACTVFVQWVINIFLLHPNVRQRTLRYVVSYVIIFVIIGFVDMLMSFGPPRPIEVGLLYLYPYVGGFTNNTFVLIITELITTRERKAQLELEKAHLEVSHLVARHEELKHKIHPHFLFNALGTLKILIKQDARTAEEYVLRLSSFLRSSLTESEHQQVSIATELEVLEDYMELQRIRFKEALTYSVSIPEAILTQGHLPVFTLQFLAENAIKHNALTVEHPLHIEISYREDGTLLFSNNLLPKYTVESSTGIGLRNLSERFRLLSAPEPRVYENKAEKRFDVTLNILAS